MCSSGRDATLPRPCHCHCPTAFELHKGQTAAEQVCCVALWCARVVCWAVVRECVVLGCGARELCVGQTNIFFMLGLRSNRLVNSL